MMKAILRLTAAALFVGAAAASATAATFTFGFEGLVGSSTVPPEINTGIKGFKFSGGIYAWDKNANGGAGTEIISNPTGYLTNRDNNGVLGSFIIEIDSAEHPGMYIGSVGFRYYGNGVSPSVSGFGSAANPEVLDQFTKAEGSWVPGFGSPVEMIDFKQSSLITKLVIIGVGDNGPTFLGLDDLSIGLFKPATVPGGNVPEPASYALVGLALLAAGAARRRV